MFKQIDEKYGNDGRVVLAAIKTDGGGITGAKAYLRGKINPDNWIIASDTNATHYKATVGKVGLFEYALIGPDGEIVEGDANQLRRVTELWMFERSVDASNPNWVLARVKTA